MSATLPQYSPKANVYYFRDPSILWAEAELDAELRELGFRDDDIPTLLELARLMARIGLKDL